MTPDPAADPSVDRDQSVSLPRVQVLIRTLDRPSLARAVQSVLDQDGPPVRLAIVAAHGGAVHQLPAALPAGRVDLLNAGSGIPLGRAAAANALLQHAAATADLVLFLDDDDWLLPHHIGRLAAALAAAPSAVAAHAGVRCVGGDPAAPTTQHEYDDDLRWRDMQWSNRLPIHAVLFRIEAILRPPALRFDETLEHFEDWDFWLRLLPRGRFVRVPGISAIYWLDAQAGSGHAADSAQRATMLARLGERQLARWTGHDVAALIEAEAERDREHRQRVQELESSVHLQSIAIAQAEQRIVAMDQQLVDSRHRLALSDAALQQAEVLAVGREQRIVALEEQLAAHRRELDLLAALRVQHLQAIERLNGQLAALLASTSWRVTRPLRLAGTAWRWLRNGRAATLLRNGWQACRTEVRRKGWAGFVRRWPQYARDAGRHARTLSTDVAVPGLNPFAATARPQAPVRLHPELAGTSEILDTSVSVVIPTLNGGQELLWLLRKLRAQKAVRTVDIVIVDSGSTDGTPDHCRALGARVVEIAPSEFSHSHARNLGAEHATGDHLLFMVQDAYPIGELWLYGMLRYLLDHAGEGVVAASCAEYPRSDSDAMYDSMIDTHYRFLGCLEADRIGRHIGDDHMSLRSMGQLSDVACLIPRTLFGRYRYRGNYAEDLDLGMRLIKDGHRIAMLASVKVVHSHNRPAWYYLKRSFVDVIFLVGLFDDFHWPACSSVPGFVAGVGRLAQQLGQWLPQIGQRPDGEAPSAEIGRWIRRSQALSGAAPADSPADAAAGLSLGDARVDDFVRRLLGAPVAAAGPDAGNTQQSRESQRFVDAFVARLDHFNQYATRVQAAGDARTRRETADAVRKTFAATLGSALAYLWLDRRSRDAADPERQWIDALHDELKAGV